MRIVIGEDETLLREGLALLLQRAEHVIVALAGDADALLTATREHRPDLVVTDVRMPPTQTDEGLRAALEIHAELPGTALLVLSQHAQRRYAVDLLADAPAGVGSCSSSGSATSRRSATTSVGSATERRCSTPSWSPRCSAARGRAATRCTG